jgi:hypothetical protein
MNNSAAALGPRQPMRHAPLGDWVCAPLPRAAATPSEQGVARRRSVRPSARGQALALVRWLFQGRAPLPLVVAAGALCVAVPVELFGALLAGIDVLERPRLAAALAITETVLFVVLCWLWLRAIARTAAHRARECNADWISGLAGLAAGVAQLALAWHVVSDAQYTVRWLIGPALGDSRLPTITVHDNGTRLRLEGALELGAKHLLRKSLDAHRGVRLVELDSPGGLVIEGLAIGRLIEARGLDTFAPRRCHSACGMAFAGGAGRFITEATRMGMHSAGGTGATEEEIAEANRIADAYLGERGVDWYLIDKGSAVPHEGAWFPDAWVLLASGLATDYRLAGAPATTRYRTQAARGEPGAAAGMGTHEGNK